MKTMGIPILDIQASTVIPLTKLRSNLDPVIVCVGHDDVVLGVNSDAGWFCELTLQNSEFSKLAMIDHLLTLDLKIKNYF